MFVGNNYLKYIFISKKSINNCFVKPTVNGLNFWLKKSKAFYIVIYPDGYDSNLNLSKII